MKDGIKVKPDARKKGKVYNKKIAKSEECPGICHPPQKGTAVEKDGKEVSTSREIVNGTSNCGTLVFYNTSTESTENGKRDFELLELKHVSSPTSEITVNLLKSDLGADNCPRDSNERLLSSNSLEQSTRRLKSDSSVSCSKKTELKETGLAFNSVENATPPDSLQSLKYKDNCELEVDCLEGSNCTASCISTTSQICTTETEAPIYNAADDMDGTSETGELHYVFEKSILTNGKVRFFKFS